MGKYSIHATKEDYNKAYAELKVIEETTERGNKFDWKKIKRVSLDELATLIAILKRKQTDK